MEIDRGILRRHRFIQLTAIMGVLLAVLNLLIGAMFSVVNPGGIWLLNIGAGIYCGYKSVNLWKSEARTFHAYITQLVSGEMARRAIAELKQATDNLRTVVHQPKGDRDKPDDPSPGGG